MIAIKHLHVLLAYITVVGFVGRGVLALIDSPIRQQKWLRIAPHVIDTLLLACGVALAVYLSLSPLVHGWLMAKIVALIAYIGFGVMAMRATSRPMQVVGLVAALATVAYLFRVAYTKLVWPF
ncbi:MAG: SirB2 family protein [Gammaproteobacteria bacterium]|nr:SirB2 family protein [Gammaproteobacteria bacterium]